MLKQGVLALAATGTSTVKSDKVQKVLRLPGAVCIITLSFLSMFIANALNVI